MELEVEEDHQTVQAALKPDAPDGTWRMKQEDIDRVQEYRKCIECYFVPERVPRPA